MDGESSPAMMMAMACAKSRCTRWKASGRSYGVGCVHTGVFPKRNSRCTWVSSSSCTTCASGVKRYLVRSLSYWSHKTLESNKSDSYKLSEGFLPAWVRVGDWQYRISYPQHAASNDKTPALPGLVARAESMQRARATVVEEGMPKDDPNISG